PATSPESSTPDHDAGPLAPAAVPSPGAGERPSQDRRGGYVGSAACRPCHEAATSAWQGSHHDLAMQVAEASTVLGDFGDRTFEAHATTTTFTTKDGRYFV